MKTILAKNICPTFKLIISSLKFDPIMAIFIVEIFTFFILRSNIDSKTTLPWPQGGADQNFSFLKLRNNILEKVRKFQEGTIIFEFMTEKNVQGGGSTPLALIRVNPRPPQGVLESH